MRGLGKARERVGQGLGKGWARVERGLSEGCAKVERASLGNKNVSKHIGAYKTVDV